MSSAFKQGYAVIIGVGADLPVTIHDATAITNLLQDPQRCAYQPDHASLLTVQNARLTDILSALDWLAAQVNRDPDVTAIVFFSGHGLNAPKAHLMPYGYDLGDLQGTALSGELFTTKLPAWPKSPLPPEVIQELKQSSGRVVIASSHRDELSYTGSPYSAFTNALLEGFAGYGAFERDGFARVLDVALYVGRVVPSLTRDRQHPIGVG